jgi:hypothetical protein
MAWIESFATKAIWDGAKAGFQRFAAGAITITSPRPLETMAESEALGDSGLAFRIRGRLKRLQADHEIWLLTQDDSTRLIWPQGFFPVQYDPNLGTWLGKINGTGKKQVRILAVVAPPTSQDFFRYFQAVGKLREYKFEPLKRIPPECKNVASVQAIIP